MREINSVLFVLLGFNALITIYAAPLEISNGNNKTVDEPVVELESLRENVKSPVEISLSAARSSVFSDVNGRRQGHSKTEKQFNKNGQLVAKLSQKTEVAQNGEESPQARTQTDLEIPSEGIHRSKEVEEQPAAALARINEIAGKEYTPLDMAEYVFWTGDEKGVTLAIEDFLEEGLMGKDDAINFLQSIKTNLDYIQAHYRGLQKMEEKIADKLQTQLKIDENKKEFENKIKNSLVEAMRMKQNNEKELNDEIEDKRKRGEGETDDYEDMMERVKGAEQMYNDYTLEEVIYQLAKLMFSQSLSQGSAHAHQALRRFTEYLEKQVEYGQISRQLEKKILAVLVTALSDTLRERPDLLPAASEGLSNMNQVEHVVERRSQHVFPVTRNLMTRRSQNQPASLRANKFAVPEMRNHVAMRRSVAPVM